MTAVAVVGIGADGWDGLGPPARAEIEQAEVLFGSSRQLALIPSGNGSLRVPWPNPLLPALPSLLADHADRRRCVLASGDPMFYGIGSTLVELLGAPQIRVLPTVSSATLACSRLGWAVQSTPVISLVARPMESLLRYLAPGRNLLVLSADSSSPAAVAELMASNGYGPSPLSVWSDLGGPAERAQHGVAQNWNHPVSELNVVAIECRAAVGVLGLAATGLPDEAYEHDGQLTKRDVRSVTLARLAPAHAQLLWDVGAGAGSIGIEWMRSDSTCRAIAVERDGARAERIRRNAANLGVPGLVVLNAAAPDPFTELPIPDAIFIGGGLAVPGLLQACWKSLASGGRLVANAVTLESEALLLQAFADHGGELTRLAVSSAVPVGPFTGWRPAMPITQWSILKP